MTTTERQRIAVLEKALKVLEVFGPTTPELRLDEISKLTQLNKSSCQRLVHTLMTLGYLERFEHKGAYYLTSRALNLSFSYLRFNQTLQIISPHLSRLADKTGLRVDLTILDDIEVVFLSRVPSRVESFSISPVGRRGLALTSAPGRALVACFDEEKIDDIFERTELKKLTSRTIMNKPDIKKQITKARSDGYAYQFGEVLEGAASIAAPIFGQNGLAISAISIGTTTNELEDTEYRDQLVSQLLKVTQGISSMALTS